MDANSPNTTSINDFFNKFDFKLNFIQNSFSSDPNSAEPIKRNLLDNFNLSNTLSTPKAANIESQNSENAGNIFSPISERNITIDYLGESGLGKISDRNPSENDIIIENFLSFDNDNNLIADEKNSSIFDDNEIYFDLTPDDISNNTDKLTTSYRDPLSNITNQIGSQVENFQNFQKKENFLKKNYETNYSYILPNFDIDDNQDSVGKNCKNRLKLSLQKSQLDNLKKSRSKLSGGRHFLNDDLSQTFSKAKILLKAADFHKDQEILELQDFQPKQNLFHEKKFLSKSLTCFENVVDNQINTAETAQNIFFGKKLRPETLSHEQIIPLNTNAIQNNINNQNIENSIKEDKYLKKTDTVEEQSEPQEPKLQQDKLLADNKVGESKNMNISIKELHLKTAKFANIRADNLNKLNIRSNRCKSRPNIHKISADRSVIVNTSGVYVPNGYNRSPTFRIKNKIPKYPTTSSTINTTFLQPRKPNYPQIKKLSVGSTNNTGTGITAQRCESQNNNNTSNTNNNSNKKVIKSLRSRESHNPKSLDISKRYCPFQTHESKREKNTKKRLLLKSKQHPSSKTSVDHNKSLMTDIAQQNIINNQKNNFGVNETGQTTAQAPITKMPGQSQYDILNEKSKKYFNSGNGLSRIGSYSQNNIYSQLYGNSQTSNNNSNGISITRKQSMGNFVEEDFLNKKRLLTTKIKRELSDIIIPTSNYQQVQHFQPSNFESDKNYVKDNFIEEIKNRMPSKNISNKHYPNSSIIDKSKSQLQNNSFTSTLINQQQQQPMKKHFYEKLRIAGADQKLNSNNNEFSFFNDSSVNDHFHNNSYVNKAVYSSNTDSIRNKFLLNNDEYSQNEYLPISNKLQSSYLDFKRKKSYLNIHKQEQFDTKIERYKYNLKTIPNCSSPNLKIANIAKGGGGNVNGTIFSSQPVQCKGLIGSKSSSNIVLKKISEFL